MTDQKFYFTFSLIDKVTKEVVGWNSELASNVDQAIEFALDTHVPYVLDPNTWPHQQNNHQNAWGQATAIYTMAYNIWPKVEYKQVIDSIATQTHRVLGPHILTHGN